MLQIKLTVVLSEKLILLNSNAVGRFDQHCLEHFHQWSTKFDWRTDGSCNPRALYMYMLCVMPMYE